MRQYGLFGNEEKRAATLCSLKYNYPLPLEIAFIIL